ncbi:MAG: hypothetical protein ABSE86_23405 [Bryobacteraceae bacterium]|jgi:hypothetical protein
MKLTLVSLLALTLSAATSSDHPTGNRTTPPTLNSVSPVGISRGTTVELTVEGLNLARASAIYFSEPGVTGKILRVKELPDLTENRLGSNGTPSTIDLGPLPPRNQVTVEVEVSPDAEIGPVGFRLLTPLGTSPEGRFLIEPYYGESADKEPNDTPETAVETYLPAILTGAISKPGDVDYFKIHVEAGQQLVFLDGAALIGSSLEPIVTILAEDQSVVREFGEKGGMDAIRFAHRFDKEGTYYIRIADYRESGSGGNFYRFIVGSYPLVLSAYPLGVELGKTRDVALTGFNVPAKISAKGEPQELAEDAILLRPEHSFNELRLALSREPEIEPSPGQLVPIPATINGRVSSPNGNTYRFHARKGQKLIVEVGARRLGSDLDSFLEVLDRNGHPIERATVRPVVETSTTLSERNSSSPDIRFNSRTGFSVGDYVMIGGEIIRIRTIPDSPDADIGFDSFNGQRIAYFDTTAEAHAIDKPIYKVQIHPPGTKFTPNGLPLVRLYYQNDDGGPGYGKDSLVHFTAPADGDYQIHIKDVRGIGGESFAYRIMLREPHPDFRLSIDPPNPNVPLGGSIPLEVTAFRMDDFDGPIAVALENLPAGFKATSSVIAPGQVRATLLLSAAADASLAAAVPLKAVGRAQNLTHVADPEDTLKLISLMPKPDVKMTAQTKEVDIEPGKTAEISVDIERQNGFGGRVPVAVLNLPPRVKLVDIGLNGVLINETETHRTFSIEALPNAEPIEQLIYVGGDVETRSDLQSVYAAPQAILLKVKATH